MLSRIALGLTLFAFSVPALAAPAEKPICKTIAKAKALFAEHTRFTPVTPGQFHFLQGLYVALPNTPEGFPPGDGALLVQRDGDEGGVILWTRGSLACSPIGLPPKVIKMLAKINTGTLDEDGSEM
jgi:hypothetical protein